MTIKLIIICSICILLFALYSCHSYRVIDESKSDNYYFNFFKTKVHYIPMGNWFSLGNYKLDSMDVKTTQVIGRNFAKDKTHVYFKSILIEQADVSSFEVLCTKYSPYAKDKNKVYYESNSFEGIDVNSFSFPGKECGAIIKDKKSVYSTYTLKNKEQGNAIILPIVGVDANTYQYLNDLYGKDETHVYFKGYPLVGADAKTFVHFDELYAKDANNIYFNGIKIQGLDAATYTLIGDGGYYKDKNGVYYGLDATYNELGESTAYKASVVVGADPETFVLVKSEKVNYAKDKNGYYWGGRAEKPEKEIDKNEK